MDLGAVEAGVVLSPEEAPVLGHGGEHGQSWLGEEVEYDAKEARVRVRVRLRVRVRVRVRLRVRVRARVRPGAAAPSCAPASLG